MVKPQLTLALMIALLALVWLHTGGPANVVSAQTIQTGEDWYQPTRRPGHVKQDRRDELQGGLRQRLRGLDPRLKLEPRSRVRPIPQPTLGAETSTTSVPTVRAGSRLPQVIYIDRHMAACAARFRSFDRKTGTYETYRGVRRRCPYLP